MQTTVVVISGKQGSGKTTLLREIQRILSERKGFRVAPLNFADPIYKMHDFCRGLVRNAGVPIPHDDTKDGTLLQMLGTEWGRNTVDRDVWVKVAQGTIRAEIERQSLVYPPEHLVFLVGDCRFENELWAFPDALRIRLQAPRLVRMARCSMWRNNENHLSEVGLDDTPPEHFDLIFETDLQTVDHCATIAIAELLRGGWLEDRVRRISEMGYF